MALVTTCPNCNTSFRVVADQLKLRRGLVRCGRCRTVFSGLEGLRRLDERPATEDTADPAPADAPPHLPDEAHGLFRPPPERQTGSRATVGPPALDDDDLAEELETVAEELAAVVDELDAWDDGESAIDYFSAERQRRGLIGRNSGWKLFAAGLLVLLLGLQATLANRDWLAARFPALSPAIAGLATPFGLAIALPRTLDALSIESFELQAAGQPGLFSVSAILHNDATHAVRWPSMLLTLTGPDNRVLARKAIDPPDYLAGTIVAAGLRPRSERPIRLALETDDLHPAGYSVELFYR